MSAKSDAHEKAVADAINNIDGATAIRPPGDTRLSDVLITNYNNKNVRVWVEVKMNHTDNLSNPRVFYQDNKWQTTYKTPAAAAACKILNDSRQAESFIKSIAKFSGIPTKNIKIPTTQSGLNEEGAVPLHVMKSYFNQPNINRYIASEENYNLGKLVTEHYTIGKKEPAHYMQAADDFYMISTTNPLDLTRKIPLLEGNGNFKVRVSTRSSFYEVQAEIKISEMPRSNYSLLSNTRKLNPLLSK
jgi:hypothetical protein